MTTEPVEVRTVFDGDTLLLMDGRRVRLLGLDTPELGRDGRPDQPGARAAKQQLEALIAGQTLQLRRAVKPRDRFGRTLAHLYLPDGRHLAAQLLRQGMGYWISVEPNTTLADCLVRAEQYARQRGLGLWKRSPWQRAAQLKAGMAGFRLLQGRVTRIDHSRHSVWVELDHQLAIKISKALAKKLGQTHINSWKGRFLQVRGWLVDRHQQRHLQASSYPRWRVRLTAASMLTPVAE